MCRGDPVTEFSAAPVLPVEIMRRGEPGGKTRAEDTGRNSHLAKQNKELAGAV